MDLLREDYVLMYDKSIPLIKYFVLVVRMLQKYESIIKSLKINLLRLCVFAWERI